MKWPWVSLAVLAVITAIVLGLWGWESRRQAEAFRVQAQAAESDSLRAAGAIVAERVKSDAAMKQLTGLQAEISRLGEKVKGLHVTSGATWTGERVTFDLPGLSLPSGQHGAPPTPPVSISASGAPSFEGAIKPLELLARPNFGFPSTLARAGQPEFPFGSPAGSNPNGGAPDFNIGQWSDSVEGKSGPPGQAKQGIFLLPGTPPPAGPLTPPAAIPPPYAGGGHFYPRTMTIEPRGVEAVVEGEAGAQALVGHVDLWQVDPPPERLLGRSNFRADASKYFVVENSEGEKRSMSFPGWGFGGHAELGTSSLRLGAAVSPRLRPILRGRAVHEQVWFAGMEQEWGMQRGAYVGTVQMIRWGR